MKIKKKIELDYQQLQKIEMSNNIIHKIIKKMKKSGVRNKVKEMQYLKKNSQSKTPLAAVQKSINTNIS